VTNQDTSVSFADLISMFLERVKSLPGEKGVPDNRNKLFQGNVIPQKEYKKNLTSTLTSTEKLRAYNTFTILAQALYDFNQSKKVDTKQGTIVRESAEIIKATKTTDAIKSVSKELGGLASLIAATIITSTLIYKTLGPIAASISKFIVKIPLILKELFGTAASDRSKLQKGTISAGSKAVEAAKTASKTPKIARIGEVSSVIDVEVEVLDAGRKSTFDSAKFFGKEGKKAVRTAVVVGKETWIQKTLNSLKGLINPKLIIESFKTSEAGSKIIPLVGTLKAGTFGKMLEGIGKFIGAGLKRVFKYIPIIGSVMSFTYAYHRYTEGKYFTALLELLSGILTLSGFPLASLAIDGVILLSDFLSDESKTTSTKSTVIHGAKLGGKALSKMLGKISSKIGEKLLKVLKWVPFVGGVVGLALSYMRFKEGDWIGGILELISAIADLAGPATAGVGTGISWVLDGVLILYDILKTDKSDSGASKETSNESSKGFSLSGMLSSIANTVGVKLLRVLKYIPFIGGLASLVLAYTRFKEGDWAAGILELVSGFSKFIGVGAPIGWLIDGALMLYDLFKSDEKTEGNVKGSGNVTLSSVIGGLFNAAVDKLLGMFSGITNLFFSGPINVVKAAAGKIQDIFTGITGFFSDGTAGIVKTAAGKVKNLLTGITDFFSKDSKAEKDAKAEILKAQTEAIKKKFGDVKNTIKAAAGKAKSMFAGIKKFFFGDTDNAVKNVASTTSKQSTLVAESIKQSNTVNAKLLNEANQQSSTIVDYSSTLRDNVVDIANQKVTVDKNINIPNLDVKVPELVNQNKLIELQNQLIMQLLTTSREQLAVTKNQKPTQVVASDNSNSTAVNSSNAFSTSRQDGRSMYNSSPYSMSPSFA
jgi:hypothetical protein